MNLTEAEQIVQAMDDNPRRQGAYELIAAHAEDYVYPRVGLTDEERFAVADAVSNQEDATEALDEYRFWRSPHGRQVEAYEAFESGRF